MSKRHWPGKQTDSRRIQRQAETDEQAALARENDRLSKMNQGQAETDEQAALAREKDRLSKMNQRQAKTDEQVALAREMDRLSKMNQHQAETDEQMALARKKHRLSKMSKCQAETDEQVALAREIDRLSKMSKCQAETDEQAALAREKDRLSKMNQRQAENDEQAALAREKDRLSKSYKLRWKLMSKRHWQGKETNLQKRVKPQPESGKHSCDMEHVINQSMKESVKFFYQTKDLENPHKHRAIVCIICDRCIIGTEATHKLTKEQILLHKIRPSVESYEEYYETKLKSELTKQYEVDGLKGMLLSPWSRRYSNGYATCSVCNSGMQTSTATKKTPPKFAIANGFVI
jgi:hypothetical protein